MKKKILCLAMALCLAAAWIPFVPASAADAVFSDITYHWARQPVERWAARGIVAGADNLFRPDDKITRAELAAILNRVAGYNRTESVSFYDLPSSAWYYTDITKLYAAGVMMGADGYMRPEANITREEAVTMFARVFGVAENNETRYAFTDYEITANYARGLVGGMRKAGYIHGEGNYFRPRDGITRAEVVKILDNIIKEFYDQPGTYGGSVTGSAAVRSSGVYLSGLTVSGDLFIFEGVGSGDVSLQNVSVGGTAYARGGGQSSLNMGGSTSINNLIVNTENKIIRIISATGAKLKATSLRDMSGTATFEGPAGELAIDADGMILDLRGAKVDRLTVNGNYATILTDAATTVGELCFTKYATVTGKGEIKSYRIDKDASGYVFETQPDSLTLGPGAYAVIGKVTYTNPNADKSITITPNNMPSGVYVYTPVSRIENVISSVRVGSQVDLTTAAVIPSNAYNTNIIWSIADPGTTGVTSVGSGKFTPTSAGTIVLRAIIYDGLGEGTNYIQNFSIVVGGTPSASLTSYTDTVAPNTGSYTSGTKTNDKNFTLNGVMTGFMPGDSVRIYEGSTVIATVTPLSTGSFGYRLSNVTEGIHTYTVKAIYNGIESALSAGFSVTVDTVAPSAAAGYTASASVFESSGGNIADGGSTTEKSGTLKGSVAGLMAGDSVRIYENGVLLGTASQITSGTWSFALTNLTQGTHSYELRIADSAGNEGSFGTVFSFTVNDAPTQTVTITSVTDNQLPNPPGEISVIDVANGGMINDPTPYINFALSSLLKTGDQLLLMREKGGVETHVATFTTNASTQFSFVESLPEDGTYTYTAKIRAQDGTEGPTQSPFTITLKTTVPAGTVAIDKIYDDVGALVGDIAAGGSTDDTSPTLHLSMQSGSLAGGEYIALYRDGDYIGAATSAGGSAFTFEDSTGGLAAGSSYTYTARVLDAAGNEGTVSADFGVSIIAGPPSGYTLTVDGFIDSVAPYTGVLVSGTPTNDPNPTLTGTATGLGAGVQIKIYENGIFIGDAVIQPGGVWTFALTALTEGTHTYTAKAVDSQNLEGALSVSVSFELDVTAPGTGISVSEAQNPVTSAVIAHGGSTSTLSPRLSGSILGGALAAGETVAVFRNGSFAGTASVSGTQWSFDEQENALLDSGSYIYTAKIRDAAGNEGPVSRGYLICTDVTAPAGTPTITQVTEAGGGTVAEGGVTASDTLTFTGTVTGGTPSTNDWAVLYRDGVEVNRARPSGSSWSVTDATGFINGTTYTYSVRLIDEAGNTGPVEPSGRTLRYELPAGHPDVTATVTDVQDNLNPVTGAVANGGWTNDTTPTINGTLSRALAADETLTALRNGTAIGTVTTSGQNFTFVDNTGLTSGSYEYRFVVTASGGEAGARSVPWSLNIKTPAPSYITTITLIAADKGANTGNLTSGSTMGDDTPTLKGTVSAALSAGERVEITRTSGGTSEVVGYADVSGMGWQFTDSQMAAGTTYSYTACVVDNAGHRTTVSAPFTVTFS